MSFRIEWKKSTPKDIRKLPASTGERIVEAVEGLAKNPFPHGAEKLTGSQHAYRIRLGDYRIVYEVVVELKLIEIQRKTSEGCLWVLAPSEEALAQKDYASACLPTK